MADQAEVVPANKDKKPQETKAAKSKKAKNSKKPKNKNLAKSKLSIEPLVDSSNNVSEKKQDQAKKLDQEIISEQKKNLESKKNLEKKNLEKKDQEQKKSLEKKSQDQKKSDPTSTRNVHFILDHSSCTLGIGNIERWFDGEFARSQLRGSENIHMSLYVPQYTLRELDYQKRGPMVGISLAQEALKLIDMLFETENNQGLDCFSDDVGVLDAERNTLEKIEDPEPQKDQGSTHKDQESTQESMDENTQEAVHQTAEEQLQGMSPEVTQNISNTETSRKIPFNIYIEEITPAFPSWEKCLKYRIFTPKQGDLPHIHQADEEELMDRAAEISPRLKNLIRSCIYMTKFKNKNQPAPFGDHWSLITEDQATKVWASSFGIDCLNVNEAELLLFHASDVSKFELVNHGAGFFDSRDVFDEIPQVGLHKRVDTTAYSYESVRRHEDEKASKKSKTGKAKEKKARKNKPADKPSFVKVNGVSYEEFDQINYAPRNASVPLVESKFLGNVGGPVSE